MAKLKKVWWYDITAQSWEEPKKPYKNYLAKCFTIGEVLRDKDCIVVCYSEAGDDDKCFDVIPRSNVIKIETI